MSTPTSDLYGVLVALLADGRWHDYHAIVTRAAKTVQPGAAIRNCETMRARRSAARNGGTPLARQRPMSTDEQIRTGSRAMVQKVLTNDRFQVEPRGPARAGTTKRVRLRPAPAVTVPDSPTSRRRSAYLNAGLAVLADGQWHDLEEVLAAAMAEVPEEQALRYAEAQRKPGGSVRAAHVPHESTLRTGQRGIAYSAIKGNAGLEIDTSGSTRRVRVKPR